MKASKYRQTAVAFLSAVALTSLIGLPALSQTSPRPATPAPGQNQQTRPNQQPGGANQPGGRQTPQISPNQQQQPGMNQPGSRQTPQAAPNQQTSANFSTLDREFIVMAAQGNNAEIQTSRLALQKSTDQEIRRYAQQMIDEHSRANERLAAVAAQYGVTLPSDPGPLNTAIAQQLTPLNGAEFDRAYMEAQENAHLRSIGLYRTVIQQGQAADVQAYASAILPSVDNHYQMANQMVNQLRAGNMGNMNRPAR